MIVMNGIVIDTLNLKVIETKTLYWTFKNETKSKTKCFDADERSVWKQTKQVKLTECYQAVLKYF